MSPVFLEKDFTLGTRIMRVLPETITFIMENNDFVSAVHIEVMLLHLLLQQNFFNFTSPKFP